MVDDARVSEVSRRLRARADAILGIVWHTPEAREGYPGIDLPADTASLAARAACLGRVRGKVVAAVFACMEPTGVASRIDAAWTVVEPASLLAARLEASTRGLAGLVGNPPPGTERALELLRAAVEEASTAGHPMWAGLQALPWPGTPLGDLWRACDMVREHRGDSHVNAWTALGVDPVEINVLSERWRGLPSGSVAIYQMGWRKQQVAEAGDRLGAAGFVARDELTPAGRALREKIEAATDRQERAMVEALGDDADELLELLEPSARAVVAIATAYWEPASR